MKWIGTPIYLATPYFLSRGPTKPVIKTGFFIAITQKSFSSATA